MLKFRRLLIFAVLICTELIFPRSVDAQSHVKASLVSTVTTVQPGQPFTVALRLEHQPHWHTYWINPGTGYPTSITWKLPDGWETSDIQWPVPSLIKDSSGAIVGYGYEGITYLPVTLKPPASLRPGETIRLAASADWLMCDAVCVPGKADVGLTLSVAATAGELRPTPAATEMAEFAQPQPLATIVKVTSIRADKQVTLTLAGVGTLKEPHFFSEDGFIQYDGQQAVQTTIDGLTLTLRISDSAESATKNLTGVLAYTDSHGKAQGFRIDAPLSSLAVTAPTFQSTISSQKNSKNSQSALSRTSFLSTLALAFVGGLILNLMPCVFPVLGIKILGFVNQAGSDRAKVTMHGVVFTLGVLLSFWTLAGVLAVFRAGGDQLGQMKQGYGGSFFTGVLATVVATPCSAPFLAPALGAALSLPAAASFAVFTTIAIGLSIPYLLLSIFPQAVRVLPRPGAWMETFKQVMAFPLYATVAYLVWVLASQTTDYGLLYALLGLTLVAMSAWLYGRYCAPNAKPVRVRFGLIGALALLVLGTLIGYPLKPTSTEISWEKWSPEAVANATASGKTVYVDFTARWCFTCQTNKKVVFGSDDVRRALRDEGVVLLKADWTSSDPLITAELAKWNRSAVPFNLVYKPGQIEPKVLPELLTPSVVLNAIKG